MRKSPVRLEKMLLPLQCDGLDLRYRPGKKQIMVESESSQNSLGMIEVSMINMENDNLEEHRHYGPKINQNVRNKGR